MSKAKIRVLDPNFVTGFTDAEGSFTVSIYEEADSKIRVMARFKIGLNAKELPLLKHFQEYFGGIGTLTYDKQSNAWIYSVTNVTNLLNIIKPHFINYPLLTQKLAEFKLFMQIVQLLKEGAHLNNVGLQKIVDIKASMNKGVTYYIKSQFSKINPVERETIETKEISNPMWVAGFVSGEGNFDAGIRKATITREARVYLRFRITQHERELKLMKLLIKYLGAGRIEFDRRVDASTITIVVGNYSDIIKKIIPFFDKYPILGNKQLDYLDWSKIANKMKLGEHKTQKGFEEIKVIESGMNKSRS